MTFPFQDAQGFISVFLFLDSDVKRAQRNFPPGSKKTCRKTRDGESYELFFFILFYFLSSSKYTGNLCCRDWKWSPGRKQCRVPRSWACATAEQSRASRRLESLRKSDAEKTGFTASNNAMIVSWQQAPFTAESSTQAKTLKFSSQARLKGERWNLPEVCQWRGFGRLQFIWK